MTTKKYASSKVQRISTQHEKMVKPKMEKLALRHNLDGTKQYSLIDEAFKNIKKDKVTK